MAYGRRRYYRRRGHRSRKGSLSNYSIATRTSARSQANQIYSLKRRINAIQRRTKPEIKIWQLNGDTITPSGTTAGSASQITTYEPSISQWHSTIDGSFARLLSYTVYFSARYTAYAANTIPVTFRVVVIQTRATRSEAIAPNDVFNGTNLPATGITDANALNALNGPLATGLARTAKVLYDKKYYLSYQRPQILSTIKLNKLLNYYKVPSGNAGDGTEQIGKGIIQVFVLAYNPGNVTTYTYDVNTKLAYTDA